MKTYELNLPLHRGLRAVPKSIQNIKSKFDDLDI